MTSKSFTLPKHPYLLSCKEHIIKVNKLEEGRLEDSKLQTRRSPHTCRNLDGRGFILKNIVQSWLIVLSHCKKRERREGFGRELSRHGRRSPKGQQLRLGSPQTRVCKRALALRPKLRGGARRAQAQCAAEVATREIRRKERGLPAGLRKGHCAPPPRLPPPQGSSGRPHVPPCPGSSPSLPLPGSGRGLLSSPPAEMALDPAEQHLRHVEKDVLIPKIMREKARERCSEQVQDISKTPEKVHLRFYQMLQGLWNPYGSKMPKRKFCIERMSNCSL
ncbi:COX assembly mitochondrial protein homolog [Leopardus geoffroyi]|uniref:COX assembly mitochondrial protein homolog n=1 Tax=Leopardus geoffroyi TaxID=46844 RepID=UPI001E265D0B|nr:COX assembly mitochondrial protein homolog [Leopardus geoffroyi]